MITIMALMILQALAMQLEYADYYEQYLKETLLTNSIIILIGILIFLVIQFNSVAIKYKNTFIVCGLVLLSNNIWFHKCWLLRHVFGLE